MLKLFKTPLAAIPFIVMLLFMVSMRIIMIFKAYPVEAWEIPLSPFSLGISTVFKTLFSSLIFNLIFSLVLVLAQINIISVLTARIKNTLWREFLTPWFFVLCMHAHPSFLLVNPQLISFSFILLSLLSLLKIGETKQVVKTVISASLLIGIAACFWLPSIFITLIILYYLIKVNKLNIRTLISSLIGLSIPFIYVSAYAYLFDKGNVFLNNIIVGNFAAQNLDYSKYLALAYISILSLISLVSLNKYLNGQLKETKDFFSLIAVYSFSILLCTIFNFHKDISIWIFMFFPISLLFNIFFNSFKRFFIAEVIHVTLLLIILVNFIHLLN